MEVSFYGGAGEVGRSAIEISEGKRHVLLDCGVKLGAETQVPQIERFISHARHIVVSHAHLDHIGFLPHMFSSGHSPSLYATPPTIELTELLLEDYCRLSGTFPHGAIRKVLHATTPVHFGRRITKAPVHFSLFNSGHILGSAMVLVHEAGGILYTGDFRVRPGRILEGCKPPQSARTLIMEGTYGAKEDKLPGIKQASSELALAVRKTLEGGGSVLLPVFAVGRSQEILLVLEDYMRSGAIPDVPIYMDGMISKANRIYAKHLGFVRPELQRRHHASRQNPFESKLFHQANKRNREGMLKENCIIVSTSGMLTGGPAIEYLKLMSWNKKNRIIFVGYQAEGTLGRRIQDGEKFLEVEGEELYVAMDVQTIKFSAHADHDDLVNFAKKIRGLKKIFLVHGEERKLHELMGDLKRFDVVIPEINETFKV